MNKNPIKPFWSWNDKLTKEELLRQIESMKQSGIDGFFMHARGGLVTEYMSEEWFDLVKACIDKAEELDMEAWAYDENGWPSGFADGFVPRQSVDFQQKWLETSVWDGTSPLPDNLLGCYRITDSDCCLLPSPEPGCTVIRYGINAYYIDTFNADAVRCFLDATHEQYYKRMGETFGKGLRGFFTDEPQYGASGRLPWSHVLPQKFEEAYGYSLLPQLPKLYKPLPGCEALRSDFYNLVSEMFKESFIGQMYRWCEDHGCKLTGHVMNEDSLYAQMCSTAGAMSCYEYFHEPGIDWLGREIKSPLTAKQLGSVASQLGKKTLTETFGLCGWDVSLNELKWVAQNQFVHGVTSLCPHLEGYTIRGCRKRDYPASLFHQLPWYDRAYSHFNDYFSRLGGILDDSQEYAPLLVVHMLQSGYLRHSPENGEPLWQAECSFDGTVRSLASLHIPHHYGDEVIMRRHGSVSGDRLTVGKCSYRAVLLPDLTGIHADTLRLLLAFAENGGRVYVTGSFPAFASGRQCGDLQKLRALAVQLPDIAALRQAMADCGLLSIETDGQENGNIYCSQRLMPDGTTLYYLVNNADGAQRLNLSVRGNHGLRALDIVKDTAAALPVTHTAEETRAVLELPGYGSALLTLTPCCQFPAPVPAEKIRLGSRFTIEKCSPNALTLDMCEYRIGDGEWQPKTSVILLQNRLLSLKEPCDITMRFRFRVEDPKAIENLCLCAETPELFRFTLNGTPFPFADCGHFVDRSIRKCPIGEYITEGENILLVSGHFFQKENVYHVLFTPGVHETERNKLTYDTELESLYITGDFRVEMDGEYTLGPRRCIFGGDSFTIAPAVKEVDIANITPQGFWFFSGEMELTQETDIDKQPGTRYLFSLNKLHAPAAELYVNHTSAGILAFAPFELDVTDLVRSGSNHIRLKLFSGNRNLLGPHHRPYGESYMVGPATFSDRNSWADDPNLPPWTDNYSFVLFGAEL